jgi:hypothetical protein
MKLELNMEDLLSKEEMVEIAKSTFKTACFTHLAIEDNIKRIISNCAYDIVYKQVDNIVGEKLDEMLTSKVADIISNLSEYSIFKKPDAWDRSTNHMYNVLQKACMDNVGVVKKVVNDNMELETLKYLKLNLGDIVKDAIMERLFESKENL